MMKHFTYEIDERSLRVKLRDLETPPKDGAWESFDEFSAAHSRRSAEAGARPMLSLNRNVLMLGVFAAVIISFSLLLFNFISIKDPRKQSARAQGFERQNSSAGQQEAVVTAVVQQSIIAVAVAATEKEPVQNAVATASSTAQTPAPAPAASGQVAAAAPVMPANANSAPAAAPVPQIIRRPQSSLASQLRPAVVTEDNEPDVKPDTN